MNANIEIKKAIHSYYISNIQTAIIFFDIIENELKKKIDGVSFYFFDKNHFIKSEESVYKSVSRDMSGWINKFDTSNEDDRIKFFDSLKKCIELLPDFTRINVCINDDSVFEEKLIELVKKLLKIEFVCFNYRPTAYKNNFKKSSKSACKDFKFFFLYKDMPFEIQFHNESSEKINLVTHGIYEVYRELGLNPEYKELLDIDRHKIYELVVSPKFDEDKILEEVGYEKQR